MKNGAAQTNGKTAMKRRRLMVIMAVAAALGGAAILSNTHSPTQDREKLARRHTGEKLLPYWGRSVFIRIIKEERVLELWLEHEGSWELFHSYPIAGMSGELGPKEQEGDGQAPEGFYRALPTALNPKSLYYLSFNIGYPNQYDREHGRTGSHIMVHGSNVSIGCFAMTDAGIEEIYTLVAEALRAGQSYVPVQVYPFRMTEQRMQKEAASPHYAFWQHLLPGWLHTETHHCPWPDQDNAHS